MIIIGLFIFGVLEFFFGLGKDVWMFYVVRVLGGISVVFIMFGVMVYVVDIIFI